MASLHKKNSPQSLGLHWLSFVMPSVADLLFVVLLLGLSCGALGRLLLRDSSTGWHIRDGQQILLTHAVPRTDTFSSTMSGKPWYAWEWLYDVAIAIIHQTLGLNGVVFYTAAIIASTFVLTLHFAMRRGGNLPVILFLLVLSLGAASVHFLARPHVASWLLAVIWFELVDAAAITPTVENNRRLFWLPALMVLWVNLHGGFLLGFLVLGVYLIGALLEYFLPQGERDESRSVLKNLSSIAILCVVASLLNPYSYRLYIHVYGYLSDRFLMNHITEFQSPNFHGASQKCFAVLFLVTLAAVAGTRRKMRASRLLLMVVVLYSGFYATRNLPTSSLLLTLLIAPVLSDEIAEGGRNPGLARWLRGFFARLDSFGSRMAILEMNFRSHIWIVLVFGTGLWACAHGGRVGSSQLINAYFDDKHYPVQAAEVIAQRGIAGPIFSLDYWGGYLIYRLYPGTKVVADDRHDLYGEQFFKDYLKALWVQPGWDQVLNEKHINWVLMPTGATLPNILKLKADWKVVYEDRTAVLLERKLEAN